MQLSVSSSNSKLPSAQEVFGKSGFASFSHFFSQNAPSTCPCIDLIVQKSAAYFALSKEVVGQVSLKMTETVTSLGVVSSLDDTIALVGDVWSAVFVAREKGFFTDAFSNSLLDVVSTFGFLMSDLASVEIFLVAVKVVEATTPIFQLFANGSLMLSLSISIWQNVDGATTSTLQMKEGVEKTLIDVWSSKKSFAFAKDCTALALVAASVGGAVLSSGVLLSLSVIQIGCAMAEWYMQAEAKQIIATSDVKLRAQ